MEVQRLSIRTTKPLDRKILERQDTFSVWMPRAGTGSCFIKPKHRRGNGLRRMLDCQRPVVGVVWIDTMGAIGWLFSYWRSNVLTGVLFFV